MNLLVLEILPMVTLIRWRKAVRQGNTPDTSRARAMARISTVQAMRSLTPRVKVQSLGSICMTLPLDDLRRAR